MSTTHIDSIEARFRAFHSQNPHVLLRLEDMAREWFGAGNGKLGIGMLFEAMRWMDGLSTTGEPFKLNNNFRSRYVRLIIDRNPDWRDRFETRMLSNERLVAA